jgi:hypothetical protein
MGRPEQVSASAAATATMRCGDTGDMSAVVRLIGVVAAMGGAHDATTWSGMVSSIGDTSDTARSSDMVSAMSRTHDVVTWSVVLSSVGDVHDPATWSRVVSSVAGGRCEVEWCGAVLDRHTRHCEVEGMEPSVGGAHTVSCEASHGFNLNVQQQQEEVDGLQEEGEGNGLVEEEECDGHVQEDEANGHVDEEEEADVPGEDLYWLQLSFAFFVSTLMFHAFFGQNLTSIYL